MSDNEVKVWLGVLAALSALIAAFAGVGGAWIGGLLNRTGAREVAEQTLEGQLRLASYAARRDWRTELVQPVIDQVRETVNIIYRVSEASTYEEAEGLGRHLQAMLTDPAHLIEGAATVVADAEFGRAYNEFLRTLDAFLDVWSPQPQPGAAMDAKLRARASVSLAAQRLAHEAER